MEKKVNTLRTVKDLNVKRGPGVELLLAHLADRVENKITQDELYRFSLEWSYVYALKDLKYRPLPIPSEEIEEFDMCTQKARKKMMAEDSDIRYKVLNFRGSYVSAKHANKDRLDWLKRMHKYFKDKDLSKVTKIEEVMDSHAEN